MSRMSRMSRMSLVCLFNDYKAHHTEFYSVRFNTGVTMELVLAHPYRAWDWIQLSWVEGIKLADIFAHPKLSWNYDYVSARPELTLRDMLAHPELPWNYLEAAVLGNLSVQDALSIGVRIEDMREKKNLTIEDVVRHPHAWSREHYSRWASFTTEQWYGHPELSWDMLQLCANTSSFACIWRQLALTHVHWSKLSAHAPLALVRAHPELPWCRYQLAVRKNQMLDAPQSRELLSSNLLVSMNWVLQQPRGRIDWALLSRNPAITVREILEHRELPWVWASVSLNATITSDQIARNPELRNWSALARNRYAYSDDLRELQYLRLAALRARNSCGIRNRWQLHKLTRGLAFQRWYRGPEGMGRRVDRTLQLLAITK